MNIKKSIKNLQEVNEYGEETSTREGDVVRVGDWVFYDPDGQSNFFKNGKVVDIDRSGGVTIQSGPHDMPDRLKDMDVVDSSQIGYLED